MTDRIAERQQLSTKTTNGNSRKGVWCSSKPPPTLSLFKVKPHYVPVEMAETDTEFVPTSSISRPSPSSSHSANSATVSSSTSCLPSHMTALGSQAMGYHPVWLKILLLAAYLLLAGISNWAVLSYTHDIIPREPLPDIIFNSISEQKWASLAGDYMVTTCLVLLILLITFHTHRCIIVRRTLFILATLYLMRSCVLLVTQLPPGYTDNSAVCREQLNRSNVGVFLTRLFEQTIRLGFQEKSNMLCGDLLFSGHTLVMVICSLTVGYYIPRQVRLAQWLVHAAAAFGALCLIISRTHYTIDILIAYWLSNFVFRSYHAYCEVDLCMERRRSCLSGFLFSHVVDWIESDVVPGRIENKISIPFKDLIEKNAETRGHHKQVSLSSSSSLAFS